MGNLLNISSSPHVRDKSSTQSIMWCVILALLPATLFGIYNFGVNAIILIIACMATCMLTEFIWQKAMKLPITYTDGSAALTGLLLALNLSSTFPVWMAVIGSVFAILVVKQLFGGLGQNFMNPALGARCFLMVSFAGKMTSFTYDGITGPTPLAIIKNGDKAMSVADILAAGDGQTQVSTSVLDMFIGNIGGTIGETSAIAILIGGAALIALKIISWKIPVCYIGTFAVFALIFGGRGFDITYLAAEICGGGIMLGAFFMATDYASSPVTPLGQIIMALGCGLLTTLIRIFGGYPEGVSYSILIMNLCVPLIDRFTEPKIFGALEVKKS